MVFGILLILLSATIITLTEAADTYVVAGTLGDVRSDRKLARTNDGYLHCVFFRLDGPHHRIYYIYSTNNGESWSDPEPISSESQDCRHPCIAVDGDNNIHVAWCQWNGLTGASWRGEIQYRRKTTSWQPIEPNLISGFHDYPSLAVDGDGVVHLAVGGYGNGAYGCNYVRYLKKITPSSSWTTPFPVSSSGWATVPELVVDANNDVHIMYQHAPRYGPYYGQRYRRTVNGLWQEEDIIQEDDGLWYHGSMALDSNGNTYVVWFHGSTGAIKIRKRISSGWQAPDDVFVPDGYAQQSPVISIDKNDDIHIAWVGKSASSPNYYQIRYRNYPLDGTPPQDLTSASVNQGNLSLIWAKYPIINGNYANIPQNGYVFVWNDGSTIRFYKSSNLAWDGSPSIDTEPTELQKVIQQEAEEIRTVTVDGEEYCIVTMKRYVDPETWEPSDYSFFAKEPPAWIVYTYPNFEPIPDEKLIRKIWTVNRANCLVSRIGSSEGISVDIGVIDSVIGASDGLASAEWTAVLAKTAIFNILDLVVFTEMGAPLYDLGIFTIVSEQIVHYSDPVRFEMELGRTLLEASKKHYESAQGIAESYRGGISDYVTAREYLDCYYNGYFKLQLGVALALPAERILESPFLTIAGWAPDYIDHLGHKVVSLVSVWFKVASLTKQVAQVTNEVLIGQEWMTKMGDHINNELKQIPEQISLLFEHESFPVDYTLALLNQDKKRLYDKWGVHGVDELKLNLCSPAELRVYDSQGRITGLVGGEVMMEIPDSYYSYPSHSITIFFPGDSYVIEIEGIDEKEEKGAYGLEASFVENGEVSYFMATDISTAPGAMHRYTIDWDALAQDEKGVTIKIDSDGDGVFERIITCDRELTQDEFLLLTATKTEQPPSTPGFELIFVVCAMALALLLERKRLGKKGIFFCKNLKRSK